MSTSPIENCQTARPTDRVARVCAVKITPLFQPQRWSARKALPIWSGTGKAIVEKRGACNIRPRKRERGEGGSYYRAHHLGAFFSIQCVQIFHSSCHFANGVILGREDDDLRTEIRRPEIKRNCLAWVSPHLLKRRNTCHGAEREKMSWGYWYVRVASIPRHDCNQFGNRTRLTAFLYVPLL